MSILIRGLNMPNKEKDELLCICINNDGRVYYDLDLTCKRIGTAIQLPPHGDLVERKAVYDALLDGMAMTGYQSRALDCINEVYVPTIIPASKDGYT